MNPQQFINHLDQIPTEVIQAIREDLPDIVGTEAINHFKENFQVEGFVDTAREPWQEVKRRMDPRVRGARATRKILTGDTGELKESVSYEKTAEGVMIYSDKPYASAHNEGTENAGRGHSTHIPKRQFIGKSESLEMKIEETIVKRLNRAFNK